MVAENWIVEIFVLELHNDYGYSCCIGNGGDNGDCWIIIAL